MNKKTVLTFIFGGVVGGCIGYFFAKYRSQQEIDDIVNYYEKKLGGAGENEDPDKKKRLSEAEQRAYSDRVNSLGYVDEPTEEEKELQKECEELFPEEKPETPYVITYNQFALEHCSDYNKEPLEYYEDNGVLINDAGECLDIGSTIGYDAVNHIGEEEEDMVFVRNDRFGTDYEVQRIHNSYYGGFEEDAIIEGGDV